jgi:hypothetical protein
MPFLRRVCARLPLVLACALLAAVGAARPRPKAEALDRAKFIGVPSSSPG